MGGVEYRFPVQMQGNCLRIQADSTKNEFTDLPLQTRRVAIRQRRNGRQLGQHHHQNGMVREPEQVERLAFGRHGVSGGDWLEHMLTSLPGGAWGFLAFINVFIFFLAFFLDFFEIAFIILPMIAPVAQKVLAPVVGADAALIWFGVMLCVNMQTSFLHPPFGFALFYLRGVAPKEVKSSDIYWGAMPWIGLQAIMVLLVIAFPVTVTGLLDKPANVDLNKIKIEVPQIDLPPLDFGPPPKQ